MSDSLFARFNLSKPHMENRVLRAKASCEAKGKPFNEDEFRQKWASIDGMIVEVMTDPIYIFHDHDHQDTISPIRGPQDEGVFFVVDGSELRGRRDPEIQYVGERLSETFWERTEYTETF